MKPAPFAYVRPGTTEDALAELGRDGAKVLAGGQSLVPVLAMRLGRPSTLVDINAVPELNRMSRSNGHLRVGATVRQRQVQYDDAAAAVPLLRLALPWVGHREIRSRGTVCGSIAHADPSAELPAVASCLDATMVVASTGGVREIPASEFFTGAMSTAVLPEELLTEVRFPVAEDGEGFGFGEFARRHGDFALAGVAVRVRSTAAGPDARISCFGISDHPVTRDVSQQLRAALDATGAEPDEAGLGRALGDHAAGIADDVVDTGGDAHASAAYRRQLMAGLVSRQVVRAYLKSIRPIREGESS
ncbi:FAD binding domain-containing protein [Nocardioides baculatus]|uniref:FAD binding domain-containing protein n=1 Tax=Nocardioides baculatus TaxID=2801337 RepID=A0ABS1L991_9ACTN|nr:FAD binding domain-containing protein [Nocardioides baculatus]MBL0748103.1 FAD binding domain-containing protein [Nocardioides baculatus]